MSDSKELPSLCQKVTESAPPLGAGRNKPGPQADATLIAGATNVTPSQIELETRGTTRLPVSGKLPMSFLAYGGEGDARACHAL
jgi:hypothetical protein